MVVVVVVEEARESTSVEESEWETVALVLLLLSGKRM